MGPEDQDPIEEAEIRRMVRDYERRLLEIGEHHARAGVHADDPVDGARRLANAALAGTTAALLRYGTHELGCAAVPGPADLDDFGCDCGLSAALGIVDDDSYQPVQPIAWVKVPLEKPDDMTNDEFCTMVQEVLDEAEDEEG